MLAVGSGAPGRLGEARILSLESGELQRSLGMTFDVVMDLAFSPDGKRLAVGAADNTLRVFDLETGDEQLKITSHSNWVTAVGWSKDGKRIASASRDKTAKVFNAENGELVITYAGHSKPVRGVMFHPDDKQVFSSGADNKIHRWNVSDAKKTAEVGFGGPVYKLMNYGDVFIATSTDKSVRQFESQSHKLIRQYNGQQDWVLSSAFHPGTKRVAAGAFDGRVIIWNAEDGKEIASFIAAPGYSPK
jgi:WD40 repeat protein